MESPNEESEKYAELFRHVELTCKSRYNASSRLQWQHTLSQWTIAALSLALLLLPIFDMSNLPLNFTAPVINVMEIVFAALTLVYSLLIGSENFSQRSEKLHRCGLELGRLARDLKPYKESQSIDDKYQNLSSRYYDILEKYENHANIDYLFSKIDKKSSYFPDRSSLFRATAFAWFKYAIAFGAHALTLLIVIVWVAVLVWPN